MTTVVVSMTIVVVSITIVISSISIVWQEVPVPQLLVVVKQTSNELVTADILRPCVALEEVPKSPNIQDHSVGLLVELSSTNKPA